MSIKRNFLYNSILTTSGYIFPLITYPYVSRTLGVDNIGMCGFVDSIINFFCFFSMMGIGSLGIREIANHQNNPSGLSKAFSELFFLTTISMSVALIVFFVTLNVVPGLNDYRLLLYIGGLKIVATPFLIEWFFSGLEDFRYITIRGLIIKCLYVVSVFLLVRSVDDYSIYYSLTMGVIVVGGMFNWTYKRKYVKLIWHDLELKKYVKPFCVMGGYLLLSSLYLSFNVIYLGFISGDKEVGYYTTASKLYTILLALFTAFTGVMLPRISSLVSTGNFREVETLISKSFHILFVCCCPLIIYSIFFAPQIIEIISGSGYVGAIIPMRIMMPLMVIIGMEQILILQLLIPLKKDTYVLICSIVGVGVGIVANLLLVPVYQSIGTSVVWAVSELSIWCTAAFFVNRSTGICIPYKKIVYQIFYSIPYVGICYGVTMIDSAPITILLIAAFGCLFYFIVLHFLLRKDQLFIQNLLKR